MLNVSSSFSLVCDRKICIFSDKKNVLYLSYHSMLHMKWCLLKGLRLFIFHTKQQKGKTMTYRNDWLCVDRQELLKEYSTSEGMYRKACCRIQNVHFYAKFPSRVFTLGCNQSTATLVSQCFFLLWALFGRGFTNRNDVRKDFLLNLFRMRCNRCA